MSCIDPPRPGELLLTKHSLRAIVSIDDFDVGHIVVWHEHDDDDPDALTMSSAAWLQASADRLWP
jgi:hypothetical protein